MDNLSFFESLVEECGIVGDVIIVLFIIATFLFFNRFFRLHRMLKDNNFVMGLTDKLVQGRACKELMGQKVKESMDLCNDKKEPLECICKAVLEHYNKDEWGLRRVAEETLDAQIPELQTYTRAIAAIGQLLPLLGLLGTILALYGFFSAIGTSNNVLALSVEQISGDIKTALVTTALGLAGGIIIQFYNVILYERCQSIVLNMELAAMELINTLTADETIVEEMNKPLSNAGK